MGDTLLPVILAGGSGTRLWPLSRKNYPKQFLCLQGEDTLLQQTLKRIAPLNTDQALIVCNDAHYFLCQEQLHSTALNITYLLEPCARNTAPAIACAAYYANTILQDDPILLIVPSDHWIEDNASWQHTIEKAALLAAQESLIITFGIKPDSPKTGYGYIEAGDTLAPNIYKIARFIEKPPAEQAAQFLAQPHFFWNSGIFVCRASVYLKELTRYATDIALSSASALASAVKQHDFIRLNAEAFAQCRSESIDYALMELTDKAAIIPLNVAWSDLGCWASVADAQASDTHGNTIIGNVIAQNSSNCLIRSESPLVTTMGVHNQIIIATQDAVLVADKCYAQEVKKLVEHLSAKHQQVINDHVKVSRPWGYYEILAEGSHFKVKRLMVKPGAKLSLQMHKYRAEHWVVVQGTADIINALQHYTLSVNQSTYIPPQTQHRLSNTSTAPLYVIEVQTGSYLGEDDIQRYDDLYQRCAEEIT